MSPVTVRRVRPEIPREVQRRFWVLIRAGLSTDDAAIAVGVSMGTGLRWFNHAGGMSPLSLVKPSGRYLSMAEREEIACGLAAGLAVRQIGRRLGRDPSTVSREITRGTSPRPDTGYRATIAQGYADQRAARPKPRRLQTNLGLRAIVEDKLTHKWSPEQIRDWLLEAYPDDPEMRVSHEAIYQALYVQGRGGLRRELAVCLRTGRAIRKPRRRSEERRGRIPNMISISERPAEADDRAVPGHWEGDLIIGRAGWSAIGTLVERSTRFCLLLHLPGKHNAEDVRDAMLAKIAELPEHLWRSLTWDQGREMSKHHDITIASGLPIYFCDPHSPWQRGSNENTNGLLRQYFPKSTDLKVHSAEHLDYVANELNTRPRKTLGGRTPAQALNELLSSPYQPTVATTA
jgi:IS30 family transposase